MHPDPKFLAAYAERKLSDTEPLEAHLADCRDCREEIRLLVPVPRSRFWIPLAAAAAVLLVLSLWPKASHPPAPPPPSSDPWRLTGGDRILLDRGARATRLSGTLVDLRAGRLWMDTATPRTVRVPGWGEVKCADAEIVVEVPAFPKASWIADAFADDGVRVFCRRGSCEARGVRILPPAPEEAFAWVRERARPAGMTALPKGDYLLSVSVKPRKATGDVGLAFPARTLCPFWVLPLPVERWTRLEVERRGSRIRLWRDGALTSTLDAATADAMKPFSPLPALQVWGADVESRDLSLREWPE